MNKNLEIILKTVQKANPELMELSFGCEVKGFGSVKKLKYVGHST